jgi:acyl carrier protein
MSESWLRRVGRSLRGRPAPGARPAAEGPPASRGAGPLSHGEIVETLRLLVVQHSDGTRSSEDVGAGDHLYERGHVDSMGGVALLTFIEDHYGVAIDEADLVARLHSLDALARHILASAPPAQP